MAEAPKHHVLPDEYRAWFEKRGFTGDMDIDEGRLAPGTHVAQRVEPDDHGGAAQG
jgi:hypothetical protein